MAVLGSARAVVAVLVATLIGGVAATALHSIVPDGGPVRGGVAVTVRGVDLENVECYFELRGYEGAPPAARVPCKYDTGADDIGFRCVCEAPPAPQLSKLERVVDPASGSTRFEYVPISGYLSVPVVVWAKGTRDVEFSPFDVLFTYYDLDLAVNVSSIEPTAGHPELETLLTVRGNGFVDHSAGNGVWCSFPGPHWDPFLPPIDPAYDYEDFTSPATVVSEHELLCQIPPMGNNSDPVFVEVCLSGHPDRTSSVGRSRHDDFCTASLTRFEYVDVVRTNLTLWNTSVLAGPIAGGTGVIAFGKFGTVDFLSLQPETDGLPDYGRPTCVFGNGLGRGGALLPQP